jgi:polyisoprenoid-binding protein YceI
VKKVKQIDPMKFKLLMLMVTISLASGRTAEATGNEGLESGSGVVAPTYNLDEERSTVYWEGSKPGGRHFGEIEVVSGSASTDGDLITGGTFEIDMRSIVNQDIGNEGMRDRLVGHLKSEDFFHVDEFPSAYFRITGAEPGSEGEQIISGDLTIRGSTHPLKFAAEISMDDRMIHATTGEIRLDRTLWNVNHMSRSVFAELKDRYISDEMIVKLDIHFARQ